MYLVVLFIPLISFFLIGVFGRLISRTGCSIIVLGFFSFSLIFAGFIFYEISYLFDVCFIELWAWIDGEVLLVSWVFFFDALTGSLLFIVCLISFFVYVYSLDYMKYDPGFVRFFCYLSIFSFFMLILVSSGNLIQLFLGWEGVGIVSYLLINF